MASYTVQEAQANLPDLLERADRGEIVEIVRPGKSTMRLVARPDAPETKSSDWREALSRVLANPVEPINGPIDSTALIRAMRDED